MLYQKQTGIGGSWLKAKELQDGTRAKLLTEAHPLESVFEGKPRIQHVAKIKVEGLSGEFNVSLNKPTINGLIDAFGGESKNWIGKTLTVKTDKAQIAGKRVTVLYLLPEGYDLLENAGGYLYVGKENQTSKDDINPNEIPF